MRRASGIDQRQQYIVVHADWCRGFDIATTTTTTATATATSARDSGHGLRWPLRSRQRVFAAHGEDDEIQPDQFVFLAVTAVRSDPAPSSPATAAAAPSSSPTAR